MAGIETRNGMMYPGETNYREASYGVRRPKELPVFFRNSYIHVINGRIVHNSLPLKIGDKGTVLEPGTTIYDAPASGENGVVIEITVVI